MEELVTYIKSLQSVNFIKVVTLSFYSSFSRVITGAVNTNLYKKCFSNNKMFICKTWKGKVYNKVLFYV